jgi:uncharacterized protein (DUF1015 family)
MADVHPFRGLRYNPAKVSVEKVVTQPYDKISKAMQDRYYALDPHNIVRIVLGKAEADDSPASNVYTRAATQLKAWREANVLEPLPSPSFVVYFQRFTIPGTQEQRVRKGFIGLGRLEDYANKVVFPHERTLSGPKQDRLQLLRHTRTHFEQIFMLYEDPEQRIDNILDVAAEDVPDIEVTDEYGVTHTLWIVDTPSVVTRIQDAMNGKKLIIADGHHRYETALAYRDEMRAQGSASPDKPDAPHEKLPMTFFNLHSPALTVLPTHRVVSGLDGFETKSFFERAARFFDVEEAPPEAGAFRAALVYAGQRRVTIGVATGTRCVLLGLKNADLSEIMSDLSAKQRALDVVVLHRLLIERCLGITEEAVKHESNITYVREFDAALNAVVGRTAQISFLLNATKLDQLRDIAYEGNVMPQKSTDFYPKVLSGLLLYSLDAL